MAATLIQDGNLLWICTTKNGNEPPWQPGINYRTGDKVLPRNPTGGQSTFAFQLAGYLFSSGMVEPTWPTTPLAVVSDGFMLWIARKASDSPSQLPPSEYYVIDETVTIE